MATWKFRGLDTYIAQLERLNANAEGSIKKAVYDGAAVVANNIKTALNTIPVQEEYVPKGKTRKGITPEAKEGLVKGFGLAKMQNTGGYINTKAGFKGKNPSGVNNATVARQVESGTSWMQKNPVIRQATNRSKKEAEKAMQKTLESEIKRLTT